MISSEVDQLNLYLSDQLVDLDQPIKVIWNQIEVVSGTVERTAAAIEESMRERCDVLLAATAILKLNKPQ